MKTLMLLMFVLGILVPTSAALAIPQTRTAPPVFEALAVPAAAPSPIECKLKDLGQWGNPNRPWPCGETFQIDVKGFPGCEDLNANNSYDWLRNSCESDVADYLDNFRSQCRQVGGEFTYKGCGFNYEQLSGDVSYRCQCPQ